MDSGKYKRYSGADATPVVALNAGVVVMDKMTTVPPDPTMG